MLQSKFSRPVTNRRSPSDEGEVIKWNVNVEAIRVIAYVNFFIMIICAMIINAVAASPRLKDGPADGSICGAFDGAMGDKVDPPVVPGQGFDVATQSHLQRSFGFNNVCANWDYSPSRELTALVFPLFEYSFLLYVILDFLKAYIYFKKGWCSKVFFRAFQVVFPFMLIGCSWFRMIFVIIAYEDMSGHTAGFFGFQITLIMVAVMNTWFVIDTKASFAWLGGQKGTTAVAIFYLGMNMIICAIKMFLTASIVFTGSPASWSTNEIFGMYIGQFVDNLWMLFNVLIPMAVAAIRGLSEDVLTIEIDLSAPSWTGEDQVDQGIALKEVADAGKEEAAAETQN